MKPLFTLVLILSGWQIFSQGQRSKIETIDIDIDQKALNAIEWPFDLPFFMKGPVTDDIMTIVFNYRIEDKKTRKKKWISFPHPDDIDTSTGYMIKPESWKRGLGDPKVFTLFCEGLHPNIRYNFKFELIRKVFLDPKLVSEMRTKLADHLKAFFKSKINTSIDTVALNAENAALTTIIKSYFPGKDLRSRTDTATIFSFNAFNLHPATNIAYTASEDLHDASVDYNNNIKILHDEFESLKLRILSDIDSIQSGKLHMNSYSKEVLTLPFNPGLKEFKAYTLLDGLKILRQMCMRPRNLEEVLKGRFRISNNGFAETDGKHHVESILFISSIFQELGSKLIRDTVSNKDTVRFNYFSPDMKTSIRVIADRIIKIAAAREQLEKVESLLPEILSTIVQLEALESKVLPIVDVVTDKTPYISAEAGICYIHSFRSAMHYRGANIYFVPIEKRAPLSRFRGMNRILKSLSVQIGVSNFFDDRPENTRSILGKSAKIDLDLALGWRLNRIIKVNAGIIPYKTNNTNKLSNEYDLKAVGFISIGLDVDLLKALGKVTDLLSL